MHPFEKPQEVPSGEVGCVHDPPLQTSSVQTLLSGVHEFPSVLRVHPVFSDLSVPAQVPLWQVYVVQVRVFVPLVAHESAKLPQVPYWPQTVLAQVVPFATLDQELVEVFGWHDWHTLPGLELPLE